MQSWWEDDAKKILIINMPPRHGKTFTARLFVIWLFGQYEEVDNKLKIITAAFNETLSGLFAQQTRDAIMTQSENIKRIEFSDVFPDTKIKYGDSAKGFWSLDGSQEKNYLSTSPSGTSTGIGANLVVVDDIVKDALTAYNPKTLQAIWEWFNNTIVQRMEKPRKQLIIMTRWALGDLAGRLQLARPNEVELISMPIMTKNDKGEWEMLCDDIMSYDDYQSVTQEMNEDIARANYFQEPIDTKDSMYQEFQTYTAEELREVRDGKRWLYTDVADTGKDFLCSIAYIEWKNEAYVTDVIYTDAPATETEGLVAKQIFINNVNEAQIESNNGGLFFSRNVEGIYNKQYEANLCHFEPFHQSKNKEARINAQSAWVQKHIKFPENWEELYPEFALALRTFKRKGKNINDDAPDVVTGIADNLNENGDNDDWLY